MIIATFGLYGIRFRRGKLFGEMSQYPLLTIRFLFVSLTILRAHAVFDIRAAMKGLSEDPEWLIKNARSVRFERRKAAARVRAKLEAEYRGNLDRAWERVSEEGRKSGELQNEVYALRRVIKGMQQEANNA